MNFHEYQLAAFRTAKTFGDLPTDLTHAALGIATEGGEFTTEVKRAAIYSKPITSEMIDHMVEELGDLLWYIALAAEHLSVPLNTIAERNIAKLRQRFPQSYTDTAAEQRADKSGLGPRES
jgi:NTP pyrophosphatase (non-canonical NTP hydrolase)